MCGTHPGRAAPALRSTVVLVTLVWLSACRPTPAPEHAPTTSPPAPAAGQVVPVIPNAAPPLAPMPAPEPTPATPATAADAAAKPTPRKATPKPASTSSATKSAAKPAASAPAAEAPPPAATPRAEPKPAAPSLDLNSLEQRLRDTKAIGVFTKLSLKNQVDDLLDEVRQYHRNPANPPQPVVRRQFEGLILKVLSSLQGGDPQLANTIAASREALWGILMDPDKFSKI